jgi:hypothetical protein
MAKFTADNQPKGRGRPKGSPNARGKISSTIAAEAMAQLEKAVFSGESWAINEVLKRLSPTLKPITPEDSLDGEMLAAKIKEVAEFEERLKALEDQANEN